MAGSVSSGTSIFLFASYASRLRLTPPSAIASCASVSSIPINFSVARIISLVTRNGGVGEGLGDGAGVGVGVCASTSSGNFVAVNPATPTAGSSFTKVRLSTLVRVFRDLFFFIKLRLSLGHSQNHLAVAGGCGAFCLKRVYDVPTRYPE